MPGLILFLTLLFILFLIIIMIYNSLIKKRNSVKQAKSSIDIYLKQRFDLIPNLIECVKGYAKYEQTLFESITKLRTEYNEKKDLEKGSELNIKLNHLLAICENYPELKSSENFLNLQRNLTKMEDQLQAARRLYNMDVTTYNTSLQTFPKNLFATLFGFKAEPLFELEPVASQNIKVDF